MKPKLILPLFASLWQVEGNTFTIRLFFENAGTIDVKDVIENR